MKYVGYPDWYLFLYVQAGSAGMDSLNPVLATSKRDPKSPTCAKRAKLGTASPPSAHHTSPQDRDLAAEKKAKESALDFALYGKRSWDQAVETGLYTNGALPQEVAENLVTFDCKASASQYQALTEKMVELYNQKASSAKKSSERPKNYEQTLACVSSKIPGLCSYVDSFLRVKSEQELAASAGDKESKTGTTGKQLLDRGDSDDRKGEDVTLLGWALPSLEFTNLCAALYIFLLSLNFYCTRNQGNLIKGFTP